MSNAANGGMLTPEATQVETVSGRFIDLLAPDPAEIDPHDIAHHLAMTCRYNGGVKRFYSVAEHVLLVRDLVDHLGAGEDLLLPALLHDAAEAYLGDLVSPLKYALRRAEQEINPGHLGSAYGRLTARMDRAIAARFGIDPALLDDDAIRLADLWAVRIEAAELTHSSGANWRWPGELPNGGALPDGISWAGGLAPDIRLAARLADALRTATAGRAAA